MKTIATSNLVLGELYKVYHGNNYEIFYVSIDDAHFDVIPLNAYVIFLGFKGQGVLCRIKLLFGDKIVTVLRHKSTHFESVE